MSIPAESPLQRILCTYLSSGVGAAEVHVRDGDWILHSAATLGPPSCPNRAITQPAAEMASQFRWRIDPLLGHLLDATGEFVALTLRDAMIAMLDLGWITTPSFVLNQNAIPTEEPSAANDVRLFLNLDGTAYDKDEPPSCP